MNTLLITPTLENRLNDALTGGALEGGWLICGPRQIGKATLAKALTSVILSGGSSLDQVNEQIHTQVMNEGHPDLFLLRRESDPKTGKLPANIKVDDVRQVISRFRQTSVTGRRVVIIDTADDLNVAAANALLKTLEEPPSGASLLLLSASPGRLLPTIRSRCRRLTMMPMPPDKISSWLEAQHKITTEDAQAATEASMGRPGRALELASGEGRKAKELSDGLILAALGKGDLIMAARRFGEKDFEEARRPAQELFLSRLNAVARQMARGEEETDLVFRAAASPHQLVEIHDEISSLVQRAENLNADRIHTALVMAMTLQNGLRS